MKSNEYLPILRAPLLYNLTLQCRADAILDLHAALTKLTDAQSNVEFGQYFATYGTYAGQGGRFEVFMPLASFAEMDSMADIHQVLTARFGVDGARTALNDLGGTLTDYSSSILHRMDDQSYLGEQSGTGYPAYVYRLRITPFPARIQDFHAATADLVTAHRATEKGSSFAIYSGTAASRYEILVPADDLKSFDLMIDNHQIMVDHFGPEEGSAKLKAWGATIASFNSDILALQPAQSRGKL